jgi:general secretion pathway protein G
MRHEMMRNPYVAALISLGFVVLLGSSTRSGTAQVRLKMIEAAIETFRMDNGRYPTTEEGLGALLDPPPALRDSGAYPRGGYLRERQVPDDPWGQPFQYQYPGTQNPEGFDRLRH